MSAAFFAAWAAASTSTKERVARGVARAAAARGLLYQTAKGPRAIAVAIPEAPLSRSEQRARVGVARGLVRALRRVGGAVVDGVVDERVRAQLLAPLSPLEREIVTVGRFFPHLATARADLLADESGQLWALELNTTIPAMQGYSDAASAALAAVARAEFGVDVDVGVVDNGARLLRALLRRYREDGGTVPFPSIALVHRAGDSQLPELLALADTFVRAGHEARCVSVDDVDGGVHADLYYRHIFAHRVDPAGRFAGLLRAGRAAHVYNEVAAPLEEKALLAVASAAVADTALAARVGLDAADRALLARHVPWTRIVADDAVIDDHGQRTALLPLLRARPADFVLKKSHDFGGRSVILGDRCADWDAALDAAVADGATVVQRRVVASTQALWLATEHEAAPVVVTVDAAAYASAGADVDVDDDGGCVSRAAASPIVNIQSGGGVLALASDVVCPSGF